MYDPTNSVKALKEDTRLMHAASGTHLGGRSARDSRKSLITGNLFMSVYQRHQWKCKHSICVYNKICQ